jgi:uncharacterized membrane protein YfcA
MGRRVTARQPERTPHAPGLAFGFAVPIAILGGLVGLGGAEFRLPVLAGPLAYSTRQAVPLNLSVSIVTIVASLAIRSQSFTLAPVAPFAPAILALIAGAVVTAVAGSAMHGSSARSSSCCWSSASP